MASALLPLLDTTAECDKPPNGKRRVCLACDGRSGYVGLPPADRGGHPGTLALELAGLVEQAQIGSISGSIRRCNGGERGQPCPVDLEEARRKGSFLASGLRAHGCLGDRYFRSDEAKATISAWGMHIDFGPDVAFGALFFPFLEPVADLDNGMSVVAGGAGGLPQRPRRGGSLGRRRDPHPFPWPATRDQLPRSRIS